MEWSVKLFFSMLGYLGTKAADALVKKTVALFNDDRKVRKAFVDALNNALTSIQNDYPDLYQCFFDEHFVQDRAIDELSKILVCKRPSPKKLVDAYLDQFGGGVEPERIYQAVDDFTESMLEAMKGQTVGSVLSFHSFLTNFASEHFHSG